MHNPILYLAVLFIFSFLILTVGWNKNNSEPKMGQKQSNKRSNNSNSAKTQQSTNSDKSISDCFDKDNRKYYRQSRSYYHHKSSGQKQTSSYQRRSRHDKNKSIYLKSSSYNGDRTGCSEKIQFQSASTSQFQRAAHDRKESRSSRNSSSSSRHSRSENFESKYDSYPGQNCLDLCIYDCYKLILTKEGTIIRQSKSGSKTVSSSQRLIKIENYDGYVHGLGDDGCLYRLESDVDDSDWHWEKCQWAGENIDYICCDLSFQFIWIQCEEGDSYVGKLYKEEQEIEKEELKKGLCRVYGKDKDHYLVINCESFECMYFNPDDQEERYTGVKGACLNYYNQVKILRKSDQYDHIKMVNWKCEYF